VQPRLGITSSRWETLPIAQLTTAIAAVEAGKFDPDILADVIERTDDLGRLARALESMARIVSARDRRLQLLHTVIPVGVSLSAERDFDRLLETIVCEAQAVCNADAGTLYLRTDDERLRFVIISNNSLDIAAGGTTGRAITFPPLHLYDEETGEPNHHNVATHAALSHQWINIPDAYQTKGFDFSGTRAFDAMTNYRSTSFLTIPLKGDDERVIGSLVLLASSALAAYIREESLRQKIQELCIKVDTAKRTRQVAEITETEYFQQLQKKAQALRRKRWIGKE
jgi:hypothetical protein